MTNDTPEAVAANHQQRMGALFGFGRKLTNTPRGQAVAQLLYLRGLRSWITPGSYAWWRVQDDIDRAQRAAAALRAILTTEPTP